MPDRHGHARQHRTPPTIRRPRVPPGQRLVRQHGWLTTDHPLAVWYRLAEASDDWSEVRLQVVATPEAEPAEVMVIIQPNGHIIPQRPHPPLGAEAIRIIATAILAAQRGS